jgi:hypothetical protein
MNTLDWEEAERLNLEQARDIPCLIKVRPMPVKVEEVA